MKSRLQRLIPAYTILPLIGMALAQVITFSCTKLVIGGMHHYNLETALDLSIPFLPWTVAVYTGAFVYWAVSIFIIIQCSREHVFRFFTAHMISSIIALVIFVAYPTTNTRPEFEVNDLFTWTMHLIYTVDTPENLLPSLHCLDSWLLFLALNDEEKVPKWYKIFACVFSLMIFASTLTTKQHVLADVITGWLFAELCYRVLAKEKAISVYRKLFERT